MIGQIRPPEEIISNFTAIRDWLVFAGIAVAVAVGIATLIGMGWSAYRKRKEHHHHDDE